VASAAVVSIAVMWAATSRLKNQGGPGTAQVFAPS
jgi:hypothetical protein